MKKKVTSLVRQSSNWDLLDTHTFNNRNYEVDHLGNFYRNGNIVTVIPDAKMNYTFGLTNDNNEQTRFKIHQIIMQTLSDEKLERFMSVDHSDRVRSNNAFSNLRYATRKQQYENRENVAYKKKEVYCINNSKTYPSCQKAEEELSLIKNTVSRVARGEKKSIHGFEFTYELP